MQSFFQRFSTTSSRMGNFIFQQHGTRDAHCAENDKAEKEAADLDKIFQMEGGMPPDPEEL